MKPTIETERYVLYLGDALKIMPTLPAGSIPMIWTDPPFGHGNQQEDLQAARVRDKVRGARTKDAESIANDSGEAFDVCLKGFLDQAARVLDRDCCCCCCCCMAGGGPNVTFARVSQWIDERLAFFMAVVWDKSARGNGMGWRYRRNYEFVMVSHRKGGTLRWAEGEAAVPNVMRDMPPIDRIHPNEKPESLVMRFIELHTQPDDMILDPFMGSGTTGAACMKLGRRFCGIEIDERYFDIAVKRIAKAAETPPLFALAEKHEQQSLFTESP